MSAAPQFAETLPNPRRGQTAQLQRLGVAAAEELRKTVRTALTELFGAFLDQLPAALEQGARQTRNLAERRMCQEMARAVPAGAARWLDTFVQQVDAHLIGGVAAGRNDRDHTGAEDTIALANVELRAEALHQALISELDNKIDQIRQTLYVPIYTKALAPAGLCRALQDTADVLGWPAAQRGMLFKHFDALVVGELRQLYRSLLKALDEIDRAATAAASAPAAPPAATSPSGPSQPESISDLVRSLTTTAMRANPAAAPKVDARTISMFQSYAQRTQGEGYHDGSLASDLLKLSANQSLPDVSDEQRWVPLQRITLAGRFLNEAIADPFIPDELKSHHESMRFPMVKSALTDSTLFTSPTHPLGSLVNEMLLKSATSRITGSAETRRMAELLEQVLVQFDLAPDFVRQAMTKAPPIDEEQIKRFFELKRKEAQRRQETVVGEAKRIIIRELERATFGRNAPAPAVRFLNTGWGPLMVKRLLQYGAEHAQYKESVSLMEQLLDRLDERNPGQPAPQAWRDLMHLMGNALTAGGLAPERIAEGLAQLEAARNTPL